MDNQLLNIFKSLSPMVGMIPGVGQIAGPLMGMATGLMGNENQQQLRPRFAGNRNPQGNTNYYSGGDLNQVSPTAVQVDATNPNAPDSVRTPIGNFDDKEIISGKRVFTSNFRNPVTGKIFSEEAGKLEKSKGKNKSGNKELKDDKHIETQLNDLFQIQEATMTAMGLREQPQQNFYSGGPLGGGDPIPGLFGNPKHTQDNILYDWYNWGKKLAPQNKAERDDKVQWMTDHVISNKYKNITNEDVKNDSYAQTLLDPEYRKTDDNYFKFPIQNSQGNGVLNQSLNNSPVIDNQQTPSEKLWVNPNPSKNNSSWMNPRNSQEVFNNQNRLLQHDYSTLGQNYLNNTLGFFNKEALEDSFYLDDAPEFSRGQRPPAKRLQSRPLTSIDSQDDLLEKQRMSDQVTQNPDGSPTPPTGQQLYDAAFKQRPIDPNAGPKVGPFPAYTTQTNTDLFPEGSTSDGSSKKKGMFDGWTSFDKMYAAAGAAGLGIEAIRNLQRAKTYNPNFDRTPITERHTSAYEANKAAQTQFNAQVGYIQDNTRGVSQNTAARLQGLSNMQKQVGVNEFTADQMNQQYRTEYEGRKSEQTRYNNQQRNIAEQQTDQAAAMKDQGLQSLIQSGLNFAGSVRTGGNMNLLNKIAMSTLKSKNFEFDPKSAGELESLLNSDAYNNASPTERERMLLKFKK